MIETYDCQGRILCCGDRLIPPYSNGDCQIVIINIYNDRVYCSEIHLHAVRMKAFFNWNNAGRPHGDGREFWFNAEKEFIKSCCFYISKKNLLISRFKKFNTQIQTLPKF